MHVRYDARNRAILGGRFQPDEGLSTPGERGSLDEIKLPSRAAVLVPVDEFPVDLAVEIDFDGGIDALEPFSGFPTPIPASAGSWTS
jgi:hypothetical protein